MLWKVMILNAIIITQTLSIQNNYYELVKLQNRDVFFPKSDTSFIDSLLVSNSKEKYYELAQAYDKLGNKELSNKYITLYGEDGNSIKLIKFYQKSKNYEKVESLLDDFLVEQTEEERVRYKILIEKIILSESLSEYLDIEKYKVNSIDKLFYYRNDDEKFKNYFNENIWEKQQIDKLFKKFLRVDLNKGSKAEELFELMATDIQKSEKKYYEIESLTDFYGYNEYYKYITKLNIQPIIKDEIEALYYLEYTGNQIEVNVLFEGLIEKYKKISNLDGLKTLYKWNPTLSLESYLKSIDEESAYLYLKENMDKDFFKKEAKLFLDKFPNSEKSEEIIASMYESSDEMEKKILIESYPKEKKMIETNNFLSLSDEEKIIYIEKDLKKGNTKQKKEYIGLLEQKGITDIPKKLKDLNRSLYFEYQETNNKQIDISLEPEYIEYLLNKGDNFRLERYKNKLSKSQLNKLSKTSFYFENLYKDKYPLEKENIEVDKTKYFFFAEKLPKPYYEIEDLKGSTTLKPQETYYLARYYYETKDYANSYREVSKIMKRYKLSDEVYNLYFKNIKKITDKETN